MAKTEKEVAAEPVEAPIPTAEACFHFSLFALDWKPAGIFLCRSPRISIPTQQRVLWRTWSETVLAVSGGPLKETPIPPAKSWLIFLGGCRAKNAALVLALCLLHEV